MRYVVVIAMAMATGLTGIQKSVLEVSRLCDVLAKADPASVNVGWASRVRDRLANSRVELMLRPSVDGSSGAGVKQLRVFDAFASGEWDTIACGGANRSGKSVSIWEMCFAWWLRDMAKDGDVYWCVAPDFTKLKLGPHKWLWDALPRRMFAGGRPYTQSTGFGTNPILPLRLYDPMGRPRGRCRVVFKTEEQDLTSFESDSVTGIAWTEATREALLDSMRARLIDTDGWLLVDYLPTEAWLEERLELDPSVFYQHFCMTDNAHNLPPGAIDKARAGMTADEAAVRIDGKSRAAFGVVVKEFRNDPYDAEDQQSGGHVIPDTPLPRHWPAWVYIDVGKYTAALLLTVGDDNLLRAVDEVYTLGEQIEHNAREIMAMLVRHRRWIMPISQVMRGKLLPSIVKQHEAAELLVDVKGDIPGVRQFKMDPAAWQYNAGNRVTIGQQYRTAGIPVVGWKPTQTQRGGEEAMLDFMRRDFMHYRLLVASRCVNLRRELRTWRHKTDKDGKIDPNDRYTGANHAIDGLKAWVADKPRFDEAPLIPINTAEDW